MQFPTIITAQREAIAKVRLQDDENAAKAEADVAAAVRSAELMAKTGEARLVEAEKEAAYFTVMAEAMDPNVLMLRRLEAAETISRNMLEAAKSAGQSGSSTIVITPFGFGDMLGQSGEGDLVLRDALLKAAPSPSPPCAALNSCSNYSGSIFLRS